MQTPAPGEITLLVRPDPHIRDGRYANNAWLQELPRPLTKLTWDNPLLVSPAIAQRLKLANGDRVTVANGGAAVTLPAWIMPGQAPDCVVALLGFGRSDVGMVGQGVGVRRLSVDRGQRPRVRCARPTATTCWRPPNITTRSSPTPGTTCVTARWRRSRPIRAFSANRRAKPQEYNRRPAGPAAWGMSIDLNACIGCNACVVACMAENNIPVVGKQQVIHEREMHWLRIDRYYEGSPKPRTCCSSRCCASTASVPHARSSAPSAPPCTTRKG